MPSVARKYQRDQASILSPASPSIGLLHLQQGVQWLDPLRGCDPPQGKAEQRRERCGSALCTMFPSTRSNIFLIRPKSTKPRIASIWAIRIVDDRGHISARCHTRCPMKMSPAALICAAWQIAFDQSRDGCDGAKTTFHHSVSRKPIFKPIF